MSASNINFVDQYEKRVTSAEEAMKLVRSKQNIVTAMAAAEPTKFFSLLGNHAKTLENTTIHCANPTTTYNCFTDNSLAAHIQLRVMFLTSAVRKHQGRDLVHYVPQHLSRWVHNLTSSREIDIFWGSCSKPDSRGFVTLGVGACYEPEILRRAKKVVLEVNELMPVSAGGTQVSLSQVDHFIENTHPLPIIEQSTVSPDDQRIGDLVASLISDESTLQLGIGSIPNAIGTALEKHRNLGIHTEMINDTIMQLYNKGVVTGAKKTLWPGKIVGAFVYGSTELYDFINNNPVVELHPASVVNDPYRIGRNHKMVSINTAIEIDITGQVCSESVGHREISGVGGASETHTGAQRSAGGRGIVAIRSTTSDEKFSKIVFELKPGAKVSISRNDIDTVVTEFGIAELAGRSVAERARALIAVAHPKFRDELLSQARKEGYI